MSIRSRAKRLLIGHRQNARLAGVLVFVLALTGCARAPVLLDTTEQTLPARMELEAVPFVSQDDYQCGPATLAMVLNYQGVEVSEETLIPQVFLPGREGSVQPEMLATVRRQGQLAFPIRSTLDHLLGHVADGYPVVVLQNLSLPLYPMWHYAVAIGYDLPASTLVLRSGEIERHSLSFRRFDATWARSQRWGFIVAEPGVVPAGLSSRTATEAISAFERQHGAKATLSSWEALTERFPNDAVAHFALGNTLGSLGQTHRAREAFATATTLDPRLGAAWLNLGIVLTQLGETEAAGEALTQARDLDGPWQARATELLDARQ